MSKGGMVGQIIVLPGFFLTSKFSGNMKKFAVSYLVMSFFVAGLFSIVLYNRF
jgi:hypothetical protein